MRRADRIATVVLAVGAALYVPWLFVIANWSAPWLVVPFIAASVVVLASQLLHGFNNWTVVRPALHLVRRGAEAPVAVLVPTYGEPPWMVERTLQSILAQDYPQRLLTLVVSDDAHADEMETMARRLAARAPEATVLYLRPPGKHDPLRRGEGKAGNLNHAFDTIRSLGIDARFVETRDCDDLVVDRSFLRTCVGQLLAKPHLGFVQTVKTAAVSPGDPFGNLNSTFYRRTMFAKNAAGAVFPCGSGLLWRREALEQIGGFPTWNLVEDVQSGIEAMRLGWVGECLDIEGAHGQVAPEDLPNMFKQRGVWALDSMRLLFWGSLRGLTLRQRLHFHETSLFYLTSFARVALSLVPVAALTSDVSPFDHPPTVIAVTVWPMLALSELFHFVHARTYGFDGAWRDRQVVTNMSFLWIAQIWRALRSGRHDKPVYRVTRKAHEHGFYLWHLAPQVLLSVALLGAVVFHVVNSPTLGTVDAASMYWAVYFVLFYGTFLPRAWFGVGPQLLAPRLGAALRRSFLRDERPAEIDLRTPTIDLRDSATLGGRSTRVGHAEAAGTQVAVVGAGVGGLATAVLLLDRGYDVTVYEAGEHTGGLARSFRWHGVDCDLGPHRLYTSDPVLRARFEALAPLTRHRRRSRLRLAGRWLQDPVDPVDLLRKLPPRQSARLLWGLLRRPRPDRLDNFDAQARARFGDPLNDLFFKPYSEKLFGIPAQEISASWATKKLRLGGLGAILRRNGKLFFDEFLYPTSGGYGAFAAALTERVGSDRIRFGHRLRRVECSEHDLPGSRYQLTFDAATGARVRVEADHVVAALPLTQLAGALGERLGLHFRSLDLYYLHIDRPRLFDDHWVYLADGVDTHVVNRVTDFGNFGQRGPSSTTVVCCEVTATELGSVEGVIAELVAAGLLDDRSEVLDHRVISVPHAYPVYHVDVDDELERFTAVLARHDRVHLVGRSAGFRHVDVDEVLVEAGEIVGRFDAMVAVDRLADGGRRSITTAAS